MKKILATLLVASMLLSCMAVVSFAADIEVYTEAKYPYAQMGKFDMYTWSRDPVGTAYQNNFVPVTGIMPPNSTPIFGALVNAQGTDAAIPETATDKDMIVFPIYGKTLTSLTINVKYDTAVLEPNYSVLATANMKMLSDDNGMVKLQASSGTAGDVTGLYAMIMFKVKQGLTGDAEGKMTTDITLIPDGAIIANGKEVPGAVGEVSKMTVYLSGLEKGTAVADPEVTEETKEVLGTAYSVKGGCTADSFAEIPTDRIVAVDTYSWDKYGVYQIYFGSVPAGYAFNEDTDEIGMKFTVNGEDRGYKAAKSIIDGKFGILIFGMGDHSVVEAAPYIKYGSNDPIVAD